MKLTTSQECKHHQEYGKHFVFLSIRKLFKECSCSKGSDARIVLFPYLKYKINNNTNNTSYCKKCSIHAMKFFSIWIEVLKVSTILLQFETIFSQETSLETVEEIKIMPNINAKKLDDSKNYLC